MLHTVNPDMGINTSQPIPGPPGPPGPPGKPYLDHSKVNASSDIFNLCVTIDPTKQQPQSDAEQLLLESKSEFSVCFSAKNHPSPERLLTHFKNLSNATITNGPLIDSSKPCVFIKEAENKTNVFACATSMNGIVSAQSLILEAVTSESGTQTVEEQSQTDTKQSTENATRLTAASDENSSNGPSDTEKSQASALLNQDSPTILNSNSDTTEEYTLDKCESETALNMNVSFPCIHELENMSCERGNDSRVECRPTKTFSNPWTKHVAKEICDDIPGFELDEFWHDYPGATPKLTCKPRRGCMYEDAVNYDPRALVEEVDACAIESEINVTCTKVQNTLTCEYTPIASMLSKRDERDFCKKVFPVGYTKFEQLENGFKCILLT